MATPFRLSTAAALLALAGIVAPAAALHPESGRIIEAGRQGGHGVHPCMLAAEASLREAELRLGQADSDYGGHRARAMSLVKEALDEVLRAYANGGHDHEGPLIPRNDGCGRTT